MSYRTYFSLVVKVVKKDGRESYGKSLRIIEDFRNTIDCAAIAFDSEGDFKESVNWYTYEQDLTEFSKKYPYAVFDLYGEGEEAGDLWHLYVKNGESVKAHVVTTFAPNPFTPTAINTSFIREVALSKLTDDEIESLGLTRSQEG